MADIIESSFDIIIMIFKFIGLFPHKKQSKILVLSLYFSKVMLAVLVLVNLVFLRNSDFIVMSKLALFFPVIASSCVRDVPFLMDGQRVRKCFSFFENSDFVPKSDEERKIMDECVRLCRRNVRFYFFSILITESFWNLLPLFERNRKMPIDIWLPYELTRAEVYYPTYIYVCAGIYLFIYLFLLINLCI